jgi:hypothetical protein
VLRRGPSKKPCSTYLPRAGQVNPGILTGYSRRRARLIE